jgi:glycosyltransferase involved in cell wall biosynthesis
VRVAALTSGRNDPSARFRVRQFVEPLFLQGIDVREYIPAIDKHAGAPSKIVDNLPGPLKRLADPGWRTMKLLTRLPGVVGSWSSDLTWLNRELVFGRYTLEGFVRRPFVFDVDDAIWQAKPDGNRAVAKIARQAAVVFAGNQHIANHFSSLCARVEIIPTAIDTKKFHPGVNEKSNRERFVIGWTGSAGNYSYLYKIEQALNAFLVSHDAELLVMAERPPTFTMIPPFKVRFVKWTPIMECSVLREMDVGLMPLPDTDWARGKCGFKMLQYMATGLPVVVSPVGVNAEILAKGCVGYGAEIDDEWRSALEYLYHNRDRASEMGKAGRDVVETGYSRVVVGTRISQIFQKIT